MRVSSAYLLCSQPTSEKLTELMSMTEKTPYLSATRVEVEPGVVCQAMNMLEQNKPYLVPLIGWKNLVRVSHPTHTLCIKHMIDWEMVC
jgi:hypothetical protein